MSEDADLWGVVANATDRSRRFRHGAKLLLVHFTGGSLSATRAKFHGLSPGGRYITCWASLKTLDNFRSAWVPNNLRHETTLTYDRRAEANVLAQQLGNLSIGAEK